VSKSSDRERRFDPTGQAVRRGRANPRPSRPAEIDSDEIGSGMAAGNARLPPIEKLAAPPAIAAAMPAAFRAKESVPKPETGTEKLP
jgi:hypothetical protein